MLLEAEGTYIPDLHGPGAPYAGNVNSYNDWPSILLPTETWQVNGYWTDAQLTSGPTSLALSNFTVEYRAPPVSINSLPFIRVIPAGLCQAVDASLATAWEPAEATPMLGVPNSLI